MALVGLDNIYVAKVTSDDATGTVYETPVRISKAMNAKITPSVDSQNIFADDTVAEIITAFSSVDVEFTISELTNETYGLLLGKTTNTDGVVIDSSDDIAPFFAFGFRAKKSNGEYRMIWMYKGKFMDVDENFDTQGDKADSQSQSIKGTFIKRADKKWRARVDTDDATVGVTVEANWFTEVYDGTVI